MMHMLFVLITVVFTLQAPSGSPPTGYKMLVSFTSGDYSNALVTDVGALIPDSTGKITYSSPLWDLSAPRFVVFQAYNAFGASSSSNEVFVGVPANPTKLVAAPK